jgi:hypothetical protein
MNTIESKVLKNWRKDVIRKCCWFGVGLAFGILCQHLYHTIHQNDNNAFYISKSWESVQGVDGKVPLVGCKGDDNEEQTSKFLINYTNTIPIQRETN